MDVSVSQDTPFGDVADLITIMIIILNNYLKRHFLREGDWYETDLFSLLFGASGAEAEDVQFVAFLNVTVFLDQFLLDSFQLGAVDFLEFTAFKTD